MGDLIFFIKSIVMTAVVVLLLQIRIGPTTLEEKAKLAVAESHLVEPLQGVAGGAVLVVRDFWRKLTGSINTKFSRSVDTKQFPGRREFLPPIKRSASYLERKALEAAQRLKETAQEHQEIEPVEEPIEP